MMVDFPDLPRPAVSSQPFSSAPGVLTSIHNVFRAGAGPRLADERDCLARLDD